MASHAQYMRLLHRALVLIRCACEAGDCRRAEAIADAVHNLPIELDDEDFVSKFEKCYLTPLVERYPDLKDFAEIVS